MSRAALKLRSELKKAFPHANSVSAEVNYRSLRLTGVEDKLYDLVDLSGYVDVGHTSGYYCKFEVRSVSGEITPMDPAIKSIVNSIKEKVNENSYKPD